MPKGVPKIPTIKQKRAIDNIASGKFDSPRQAMIEAGYTPNGAIPNQLMKSTTVQDYINAFEYKAKLKFRMGLDDKLMEVYLEGLDAKTTGKFGGEKDHKTRKEFADTISKMKGYIQNNDSEKKTQVNFFQFNQKDQEDFNKEFIKFLKQNS